MFTKSFFFRFPRLVLLIVSGIRAISKSVLLFLLTVRLTPFIVTEPFSAICLRRDLGGDI